MKNSRLRKFSAALMISQVLCINAQAATYYNLDEIKEDIYSSGQNRETSYTFTYKGSIYDIRNDLVNIVKEAYAQDDYLDKSWGRISYNAKGKKNSLKVTVNTSFVETKEEENYVDEYLKNAVNTIITNEMSDYDKVMAISNYIENKFSYDNDLYTNIQKLNSGEITDSSERNDIYRSTSVYSALNTSKTICQGYSMTAYKMLKAAGVECKIISGTLNGGEHVWNKVKVNGQWLYLDITCNDVSQTKKYFLVSKDILSANGYLWVESDENSTQNN